MTIIRLPINDKDSVKTSTLSGASSHPDIVNYRLRGSGVSAAVTPPRFNRIAYAAAHIVTDPLQYTTGAAEAAIDWDSTLAFREHLWRLGFKVAEAMDTAQRGHGLNWPDAQQLIRRSLSHAHSIEGADLACGINTDQLVVTGATSLDDVIHAYQSQLEFVEKHGGRAIMMASRALAQIARSPDAYYRVYNHIIGQSQNKIILHWLGEMFDPLLAGYWTGDAKSSFEQAVEIVLTIIADNPKIEGIKISLLDSEKEILLRQRLPADILCFTGDDFNYPSLIEGSGSDYSHALLGIFAAIAPTASQALTALADGDHARYRALLQPTVALSRTIFAAPTQYYKAGIVFLAWLNGHQNHFTLLAGMQSARSLLHYAEIFRLADQANSFEQPDLAAWRMKNWLALHGIT